MTVARPTVFWVTITIIALVMLVLLREILLPFAVGMALAYLLVPTVERLERVGINRGLAALILIVLLAVGFVGLVLVMLPALVGELRFFIDEFPRYVTRVQSLAADTGRPWLHRIMGQELRIEESITHTVAAMGSAWLDDLVRSAWSSGKALFSLLSLLVVVPIVSIYLLADWNRMIATIDGWVPAKHRKDVRALGREIHETVAGFVRGQIVICLILAVFYSGALRLTGLNHAVLIGLTAGLISFVPYLGLGIGFVVAACVAIAQFWPDWTPLAVVAGIFLIGETIADYVLSPRIVGSRVKLNPVWLMFALFAFGYLFGFVGLLIAIPLAASLGVILRFSMRKALANPELNVAAAPFAPSVLTQGPVALGRGGIGPPAEEVASAVQREAVAARPGAQPEASGDTSIP
ncbi:AI-2E family transporter [Microvirga brassicacearum]|uniref:AI-2E family transporter n=1 Tax=Microvirga brassicacearum TaxID=2580413 RepID=A0A5N3P7S5_9HYPH|nr:AI-2E family transporter [Microvirga brassicacearum]KAB0265772.1 AI-2E family transporter [Microvirga brassicacearum]